MKVVSDDIDNHVKSCQVKAAINLVAAWLENALVFQIDNELILELTYLCQGFHLLPRCPGPTNKSEMQINQVPSFLLI